MPLAVIGISLRNRRKQAPEVQEGVLTKYGDLILARSGVHDPGTGAGAHHLDGRGVRRGDHSPAEGAGGCLRNFSRHSSLN